MNTLVSRSLTEVRRTPVPRVLLLTGSVFLLTAFIQYDYLVQGRSLLEKGAPDWSSFGWVKTAGAFICAWLFVAALFPVRSKATRLTARDATVLSWVAALSAGVLVLVTIVVLASPEILNRRVREGQMVGVLTEVAFLAAFAWLTNAAVSSRDSPVVRPLGIPLSVIYSGMLAVAFLILMEEMSWGQHWIGWSSGALFEGNAQNETNLHNFATYKFEACYYVVAFLLFVALPAFWPERPLTLLQPFSRLVPPRLFLLAGLPLSGLWFEEWNTLPYQVCYFSGVLISVRVAFDWRYAGTSLRVACGAMALLLVTSQAVFLSFGHEMVDGYELSEVREFLIACLIASYAWLAMRRETVALSSP